MTPLLQSLVKRGEEVQVTTLFKISGEDARDVFFHIHMGGRRRGNED